MTEFEQLVKKAASVICPLCDEMRCPGRFQCPNVARWVKSRLGDREGS